MNTIKELCQFYRKTHAKRWLDTWIDDYSKEEIIEWMGDYFQSSRAGEYKGLLKISNLPIKDQEILDIRISKLISDRKKKV